MGVSLWVDVIFALAVGLERGGRAEASCSALKALGDHWGDVGVTVPFLVVFGKELGEDCAGICEDFLGSKRWWLGL